MIVSTCGITGNNTLIHLLSNAVGVDYEELKRARDAYCNAQLHLMNVREAQIVKLKNCPYYGKPTAVEDLT